MNDKWQKLVPSHETSADLLFSFFREAILLEMDLIMTGIMLMSREDKMNS